LKSQFSRRIQERAIDSLTPGLAPASLRQYRAVVRSFLIYLGEQHPAIDSLNQLRRDPHILGWFVDLRSNNLVPAVYIARLLLMRCMLQELAWNAQIPDLAHLIRREDIPREPQRLPRALTPQQDQLIQQELLRRNDLPSNVLLLMRHTGMRIGECADLADDCLHNAGPDRWAIHVPLGKLKTERRVPIDSFVCQIVHRLRFFRSFDPLPFDGSPSSPQADPCQATAFLPSPCCRCRRYPNPHRAAPAQTHICQ
jgi:integrase